MNPAALLTLAGGTAAVLGLVVLLAAWLRKARSLSGSRIPGSLRITQRTGLGPRQGVAVVEVDGRRLLVGCGEGGVRFLTELEPDDTDVYDEPDVPGLVQRQRAWARTSILWRSVGLGAGRWNRVRTALRGAVGSFLALTLLVAPLAGAPPAGEGDAAEQRVEEQVPGGVDRSGVEDLLESRLPDLSLALGREDGEGLQVSGPVGIVLFMGFLTLLPTLLLLMTSFTRILVVLHLLKQAIGTQTAPPGHLIAALALLLTGFVMAPTLAEANRVGIDPWVNGEMDEVTMLRNASVPFRDFMLQRLEPENLDTFLRMGRVAAPATIDDVPLVVVATAFVTSELRAAFQLGFALFIPFVVIDLVVASVLMSMGMFMLPPVMVSLPFKLLLFVMVDGWTLVMEGLVRSFL